MLGTPVEAPTNNFIDAAVEMYPEVKLWSLIAFARGRINLFQVLCALFRARQLMTKAVDTSKS